MEENEDQGTFLNFLPLISILMNELRQASSPPPPSLVQVQQMKGWSQGGGLPGPCSWRQRDRAGHLRLIHFPTRKEEALEMLCLVCEPEQP